MITPKQTVVFGMLAGVLLWVTGYIVKNHGEPILKLLGVAI